MRGKFIFSRPDSSSGVGFTLIEVLIVVALIGILTGGFLVLVNPKVQLEKSRDSQRKSHLRQIQSALEVYRADCGVYPTPTSYSLGTSLTAPASCSSSTITYMQTVPVDPETKKPYYYCTTSPTACPPGGTAGALYSIYACLEINEGSDGSGTPCAASVPYIRYHNP